LEDLSLHILDIIENSVAAGATHIKIIIDEDIASNVLTIKIEDNGRGMDKDTLDKALDPFYTTKKTRRVGLGLSMLAQATQESEGSFDIKSRPGKGTRVTAKFVYDHIDRKPLGNMAETITTCIAGSGSQTDLIYRHSRDDQEFIFDTKEIKERLNGVAIDNPEIVSFLKQQIEDGLKAIAERS
jgi:K+-sensing histidine kinase KdpD